MNQTSSTATLPEKEIKQLSPFHTVLYKLVTQGIQTQLNIKNFILIGLQNVLFSNYSVTNTKKILIWRGGSLGDSVCAFPAISCIRDNFPNAQIDILTTHRGGQRVSMGQLIDNQLVQKIYNAYSLTTDKRLQLIKQLKQEKYDLLIELPENLTSFTVELRNLFLTKYLGVPAAFGWRVETSHLLAQMQQRMKSFQPETTRLLDLLKEHKLVTDEIKYPLQSSSTDEEVIRALLQQRKSLDKEKNVGVVVGANRSANKWPIEFFEEVIEYLLDKSMNIFLIGGQVDYRLGTKLEKFDRVYNFCGKLTPAQSGILFKYCKITVSNDTGPMHLSYAVGTPVIALFSARDFSEKWYPPEPMNTIFRTTTMNCSPCFLDFCPYDNLCLRKISPQKVIQELKHRGI